MQATATKSPSPADFNPPSTIPALLKQRQRAAEGKEATLGPALTKLGACVRYGYQTYEHAALGFYLRGSKLSRRQLHDRFAALKPHLPPAKKGGSWDDAVNKIEAAVLLEELDS